MEHILSILYAILVITTLAVILADSGDYNRKVGWILVIALFPGVGVILYIMFGINQRHHHIFNRRHRRYMDKFSAEADGRLTSLLFSDSFLSEVREDFRPLAKLHAMDKYPAVSGGNSFEIITSGKRKFELLLRDLENARESIHMEYFHFGMDKGSKAVRELLIRKASEGVKVRFLNENIANLPILPYYYNRMRRSGVEVVGFTTPKKHLVNLITRLNYRNHRKIVVIDGRIGYTGGMNINDHYFLKWRDTHLRIEGNAVASLQYIFLDSWLTSGGTIDRKMTEYYPMLDTPPKEGKLMQVVPDEPDGKWPVLMMSYEWLLANAKDYVYLQTPYFVPPIQLQDAMRSAALRGVDVRLMVPAKPDTFFMGELNRGAYKECLEAGVKIYERGGEFMHCKTIVCDDYLSCIGSANLNSRSFNIDYEVNTYIYDSPTALRCKEIFFEDLSVSREVPLQEVLATPYWKRLLQGFLRLFSSIV